MKHLILTLGLIIFVSEFTFAQNPAIDTIKPKPINWVDVKTHLTNLMKCQCIDAHIELLVNRRDTSADHFQSPLYLGYLIYGSTLERFKIADIYALTDTFQKTVVDVTLNEFIKSYEGNTSMLNVYSWCDFNAKEYIRKKWKFIKKLSRVF
ncbi:hypothetical protein ACQ33O_00935 [Ferruginibacter sp. SUN002]|uniref:hypothetical protein n=1 Tax=Ferruginibacter sp. SUN002 TaxID=2937789 RepID=UPI003D36BCDF